MISRQDERGVAVPAKARFLERLERERSFHDTQAVEGVHGLLSRMAPTFYDVTDTSIIWGPVWEQLDLSGTTVLDYGCGTANMSRELARWAPNVYGIDISEGLISVARKRPLPRGARNVEFSVQDCHRTDFPDNFFDFVFGTGILHHLEADKAYAEIARILKPGGRAFFSEPLDGHPIVRLVRRLSPNARTRDERPLNFHAISRARRFFATVAHTEFFFLAVGAAPLHLISSPVARRTVRALHRVDRFLFTAVRGLRPFAWMTLIELEKS